MIKGNGYKKGLQQLFYTLPLPTRRLIEGAHKTLYYDHLVGSVGPYTALAGLQVNDGTVVIDPAPNGEYIGSLAGSWIWTHPQAFFRFRIITSKERVEIWEFGATPCPPNIPPLNVARTA